MSSAGAARRAESPCRCPTDAAGCSPFSYVETSAARGINTQQKQKHPRVGVPKYVTCCLLLQEYYFRHPCWFSLELFYREPIVPFLLESNSVNPWHACCCCLSPTCEALRVSTWLHYHESPRKVFEWNQLVSIYLFTC